MGSKQSGNAGARDQTVPLEEAEGGKFELPPIEADLGGSRECLRALPENFGIDDGLLDGDGPKPPVSDAEGIPPAPRPINPPNPWSPDHPQRPHTPPSVDGSFQVNYSTKKTIAQGMMDLALLTANASQLRYIMHSPHWDVYHKMSVGLISVSIALQIIVGISLIFIGHYDYRQKEFKRQPQLVNNIVVALVFVITVVNIFIATFGVDDYRPFVERPVYRPSVEPLVSPAGSLNVTELL